MDDRIVALKFKCEGSMASVATLHHKSMIPVFFNPSEPLGKEQQSSFCLHNTQRHRVKENHSREDSGRVKYSEL